MKRTAYKKLINWKNSSDRKPLILKGARQVGKTYLLNEFGKKEFQKIHYLNFQKTKELGNIFEGDLSPVRILELVEVVLDSSVDIQRDVVFFDEIQDCPRALTSLKYFCEDMPELALVCAGSLLGVVHSDSAFPVGKVSFLHLHPMSFMEFLIALGDTRSLKYITDITKKDKIPLIIHNHLMELLKEYFIVGGMPEVVSVYIQNRKNKNSGFEKVRAKQNELITAYMGDFSKYSGKVKSNEIVSLFEAIPAQLAKENKKFISSKVISGGRFSKLRSSIDWLTGAGLIIKVKIANSGELPFSAFTMENRFKLYLFDVGLLGALGGLSPKAVYMQNNLFATFKGAFCENFVAQEFMYTDSAPLYAWAGNTSEVEFIKENDGDFYPIEVKAGLSGKLKSLNVFSQKYNSPYRTRISGRNLEINDSVGMHSYPLYLAFKFPLK
ncbi:MAG: AAA family ATPase [Spirochaetales bacterium]|nr:AAA family ATPase [Spirochaetales bacterium]